VPELPDITIYLEALSARVLSRTLDKLRLASPFVLRTVEPAPADIAGKRVVALRRLGKRIVFELEDEIFIVVLLMIAGRFKWLPKGGKVPGKIGLAAFDSTTDARAHRGGIEAPRVDPYRARRRSAAWALDPGGMDVLDASLEAFRDALTRERHTLKRTLTDPHVSAASATLTPTRSSTARASRPCR
jgi:formamidopyrimidine-DNA glycosylase